MGILDKKIADTTWGGVFDLVLLVLIALKILEQKEPRETKKLPPGHPDRVHWEVDPYDPWTADLIRSLREMKELAMTPDGGWDQYRKKFAKYLEDVRVLPKYRDDTKGWPAWMRVPPRVPRDRRGNLVTGGE